MLRTLSAQQWFSVPLLRKGEGRLAEQAMLDSLRAEVQSLWSHAKDLLQKPPLPLPVKQVCWKKHHHGSQQAWYSSLGKGQEEETSLINQLCPYPFSLLVSDERIWALKIIPSLVSKPWNREKMLSQFSRIVGAFSVVEKPPPSPKALSNPMRKQQQCRGHGRRCQQQLTRPQELSASGWGSFGVGCAYLCHLPCAGWSHRVMNRARHAFIADKTWHSRYVSSVHSSRAKPPCSATAVQLHWLIWGVDFPFLCLPSPSSFSNPLVCISFLVSDLWEFLFSIEKNSSNSRLPSAWQP